MARPLRIELSGGLYHVTARGKKTKWGQANKWGQTRYSVFTSKFIVPVSQNVSILLQNYEQAFIINNITGASVSNIPALYDLPNTSQKNK